ncbi:MAG: HAMP domain-containing sensor histidine kinase [Pseudomonadota bacterium]
MTKTPLSEDGSANPARPVPRLRGAGLSVRLLVLTVIGVMFAEVLIFLPSVANFREKWLMDRLEAAQIVALAAEDSPTGELSPMLKSEILSAARVRAVAIKRDFRRLVAKDEMPARIDAVYDLRDAGTWELIRDAVMVYFHGPKRSIRVIGKTVYGKATFVEIVVDEAPLRAALVDFGLNILALSIVISMIAASLVYLALNWLLVRPMQRIVRAMEHYSADPEDASRILTPTDRGDEIGIAEHELARMQDELSQLLKQKNRLAALGLAVSKINHDLRNMLASAQLISDRFAAVDDPIVKRFAPKLIGALDRAVDLCRSTLKYGKAEEARPQARHFQLLPFVEEVTDQLGLPSTETTPLGPGAVALVVDVPDDLRVFADRDQLYRVLGNVVRNAAQVVASLNDDQRRELEGRVEISAEPVGHPIAPHVAANGFEAPDVADDPSPSGAARGVIIHVRDTGPGFPIKARDALFRAFVGSARQGGTGLGLAIADELMRAHGGWLRLCDDDTALVDGGGESVNGLTRGAHFELFLPGDRASDASGAPSPDPREGAADARPETR